MKTLESQKVTTDAFNNDGRMLSSQSLTSRQHNSSQNFQPQFVQAQFSSGHINPKNGYQYAPNSLEQLSQHLQSLSVVCNQNQQVCESNSQQQFQLTPLKQSRHSQLVPYIGSPQHYQKNYYQPIQQNYKQPQQYHHSQIHHQQILQPQSHSDVQHQCQIRTQCDQQDFLQHPNNTNMKIMQFENVTNMQPFQQAYPKQLKSGSQSHCQHGFQMTQQCQQPNSHLQRQLHQSPKIHNLMIQSNSQCHFDPPMSQQCLHNQHCQEQYQKGHLQPSQRYLNDKQIHQSYSTEQMQPFHHSLNYQQIQPQYRKELLHESQFNSQQPTQQYDKDLNQQHCQSSSKNLKELDYQSHHQLQSLHIELGEQQLDLGPGNVEDS